MKRISAHHLGILQGSRMMFSDFAHGGPMWTGSGPREVRHRIEFDQPFLGSPSVMVSISLWDADRETNLRADVSAEHVTAKGFDLVFRTWSDSRIARARCDWTALGALPDDELWELD